jgi:predicted GIY-YIG superfamily endonuclease
VIDRFQTHQKRLNKSTKPYTPFLLIDTEECVDRKEARRIEKYWKGGSGKRKLKLLKSKFMSVALLDFQRTQAGSHHRYNKNSLFQEGFFDYNVSYPKIRLHNFKHYVQNELCNWGL